MILRSLIAGLFVCASTAALASTTAAPSSSHAQTGADLYKLCETPQNTDNLSQGDRERLRACGSYIQGFLGHYSLARGQMKTPTFCLPGTGTSPEQVRVLFVSLIQKKPEIRDLPASVDLATSLAWGYPCKS